MLLFYIEILKMLLLLLRGKAICFELLIEFPKLFNLIVYW